MVVVPTFTKTHKGEEEIVFRFVMHVVFLAAKDMANRVDRPCDVMDDENASKSAPKQTQPSSAPRLSRHSADDSRQRETERDPKDFVILVNPECRSVLGQVWDVMIVVREMQVPGEQPTAVG